MKFIAPLILVIWLLGGLFIGVSGLTLLDANEKKDAIEKKKDELIKQEIKVPYKTQKGVTISNRYQEEINDVQEDLEEYFSWIVILPNYTALMITAMGFGLLGATINVIKDLVFSKKTILEVAYISLPVLGLLTGLVVLGITYVLPTVLTKESSEIRPLTLMFICLFCGISTEKFYIKVESFFDKLFNSK